MIGGTKGINYEINYRQTEDLFNKNLDEIKLVRDTILDITKSTWLKDMQKFRVSMTNLENIIKNLIDCMFKEVRNIEEGIEAIYAFRSFKHKECIRQALLTKWMQVRKKIYVKVKIVT